VARGVQKVDGTQAEGPAKNRERADGNSELIFMYRKKSGKSIRADIRLPRINTASTTIPKTAIANIILVYLGPYDRRSEGHWEALGCLAICS
jgi:hypothetical protein